MFPKPSADLIELLQFLNAHKVRYLLVGGLAVMYYTEPRFTKDSDVLVSPDKENAEKVFRALAAFGAPLEGITAQDFAEEGVFFQMGRAPMQIDIITSIQAIDFEEAWERRVQTTWDDLPVNILSREDLIRNKEAVAREQDMIDVKFLKATRRGDNV